MGKGGIGELRLRLDSAGRGCLVGGWECTRSSIPRKLPLRCCPKALHPAFPTPAFCLSSLSLSHSFDSRASLIVSPSSSLLPSSFTDHPSVQLAPIRSSQFLSLTPATGIFSTHLTHSASKRAKQTLLGQSDD